MKALIVEDQLFKHEAPFQLANGGTLPRFELCVQTYGELNDDHSNAVLICHALTGSHHVTGKYHADDTHEGWWSEYVGPGKPIDTNRFFVVGVNNLGSCLGSTGPTSINPETNKPYGPTFPSLRVRDWVASQYWLMHQLNIRCWAAVIGGSLGGMQALRWNVDYPNSLRHCVVIASAPSLTAQNIAFNELARQAISSDPKFSDGKFEEMNTLPEDGLALARMIGHVTYLSGDGMNERFGRDLREGSFALGTDSPLKFQIESYLHHQGKGFAQRFDANSYILLTRILDYFDLSRDFSGELYKAFEHTNAHFFVISFSTDWRFSPDRSQEIVDALIRAERPVSYVEIRSDKGHDAFLIKNQRYIQALTNYMKRVAS